MTIFESNPPLPPKESMETDATPSQTPIFKPGTPRKRIIYDLEESASRPAKKSPKRTTVAQRLLKNNGLLAEIERKEAIVQQTSSIIPLVPPPPTSPPPDEQPMDLDMRAMDLEQLIQIPPPPIDEEEPEKPEFKTPIRSKIVYDLDAPTSTKSERGHSGYGGPPSFMKSLPSTVPLPRLSERRTRSLASFDSPRIFVGKDGRIISAFFTKRYCFSNHFVCPQLVIDGENFVCTEQYYMYWKAKLFGDEWAAKEILSTEDPKAMKRLGSSIRNFNQGKWDFVSIDIMAIANMRKYEQNPRLRAALFQTADTLLVEASPMDNRWGIGMDIDDPDIRDPKCWRGKNILGRLLTKIRDRLMARPEFADEVQKVYSEYNK